MKSRYLLILLPVLAGLLIGCGGESNPFVSEIDQSLMKFRGYVWEDGNKNGVQDGNEFGIRDVRINLLEVGEDGSYTGVHFTFTDDTGEYRFIDIPSGNYVIEVKPEDNYDFTKQYSQEASRRSADVAAQAQFIVDTYITSLFDSDIDPKTGLSDDQPEDYQGDGQGWHQIDAGLINSTVPSGADDAPPDTDGESNDESEDTTDDRIGFNEVPDQPEDDAIICFGQSGGGGAAPGSNADIDSLEHGSSSEKIQVRVKMVQPLIDETNYTLYIVLQYGEESEEEGDRIIYTLTILDDGEVNVEAKDAVTGNPIDTQATATYNPETGTFDLTIPLNEGDPLPDDISANGTNGTDCDSVGP